MKILAIECSATPASCAIFEDEKLISSSFANVKLTHSETLMPMVEATLKNAKLTIDDVETLAVSCGPGSFTGIRIGISAIKGLAIKDKKPCCAVSTLASMAYRLRFFEGVVCAVMDARCNQVYNALFRVENGRVIRLCDDRALMIDELYEEVLNLNKERPDLPIILVGDGADLFFNSTKNREAELILAPEHLKWQRASGVCFVAESRAINNETVSAEELLPIYLRLPQAERELKAKQLKGSI